ncbi:hypothetical protein ABB37_08192 [Leptomonas pyrrhocoris]|uniref:Uncharacterized protein n=1 Tax=Leptomonas pyrrhocoris TaxID=157538 RepID=A0A0N0VDN3_LEPPY|nr:hypothetical protein ABB37_08192 [Leptomonas pyrrhocoris]KPA76058.1 hypothetical protein ABB37_08192 [Leptomonas pyrrhocoris]|eukprot:XP_015654497.1 hypothetical protein ABB37_08192 [Leptomonas pyrrhocoris]
MKGKVHYVTIPAEEWTDLTVKKCRSFSKKYGVSWKRVWEQVRSGNTTNRTFPLFHYIPHLLSNEELIGDIEELKRIVRERELNGVSVASFRSRAFRSQGLSQPEETSDSDVEPCEVPPALPHRTINEALARVYDTRATACFGLHLLVTVQNEDAATPNDAGVRSQLSRLPMSALHNIISELSQVRSAWERELLAPCAAALAEEQAHTEEEKINALLFHICLWQRRYPLELLLCVLSFHSEHRDAFLPATPADQCEPYRLEQLLEELQRLQYPDLSDVPGLIRCDVLMTHPKMPLGEQTELMRRVAASCQRRMRAAGASDNEEEDGAAQDALRRHSRSAPDPQLLLARFVPPGVRTPRRFCSGMSTAAYREMRAAFERHKRDGVRRLAVQDYDGESTSSARQADDHLSPHGK